MNIERQVDEAVYLLQGIENGGVNVSDVYNKIKDADPVVIYFFIRYLREKYPPTNPSAQGVIERLLELTSTYPDLVAKSRLGEKDILREWFDESYAVKEFYNEPERYFSLIYEKLEG